MTKSVFNDAVVACLDEMHARLAEAARIAKAAQTCAQAGSLSEAVTISMDIEQLIYEAGRPPRRRFTSEQALAGLRFGSVNSRPALRRARVSGSRGCCR